MSEHGRLAVGALTSGRGTGAEELRLLARIRDGDRRAFDDLYRIYQPRLTRFLGNLLRRPQLVEEVLDDTLLVLWERPESFRGRLASIGFPVP